jgi:predicted MFS family arabinose efflux permease
LSRKGFVSTGVLVLAAGFLVLFIGGGGRFAVGLTLRPMVGDLGWGRSELGAAVALYQVISALMMFAAGRLADRAGPRLVLCGGLVVSAAGIGLMGLVEAPWHAMVLYGVVYALGSGAASLIPVGVMVTRAFPGRAGLANAVVMSGMSVGQIVVIASLAAVLLTVNWQAVYLWLGLAHVVLVPLLFLAIPKTVGTPAASARLIDDVGILEAARSRQFWLLIAVYAVCGFGDFFVSTHVVAMAEDRGVSAFLAGNLLALMGLTGLIGVVAAGAFSDRAGPIWPTVLTFAARVIVSVLVLVDRSTTSVAVFALVFGATFMVTAPLTVVFVQESFGMRHLGALAGLITMVHQICGGLGAWLGAAIFDARGNYNAALSLMLALSLAAMLLTLLLRRRGAAV